MVLTHLALFRFISGAGGIQPNAFSGFTSVPPLAFFPGFGGEAATPDVIPGHIVRPPRNPRMILNKPHRGGARLFRRR